MQDGHVVIAGRPAVTEPLFEASLKISGANANECSADGEGDIDGSAQSKRPRALESAALLVLRTLPVSRVRTIDRSLTTSCEGR